MTKKKKPTSERIQGVRKCRICPGRKAIEPSVEAFVCGGCQVLVCRSHIVLQGTSNRGRCHRCAGVPLPGEIRTERIALRQVHGGTWSIYDPTILEGSRRPSSQPWEQWVEFAKEILKKESKK